MIIDHCPRASAGPSVVLLTTQISDLCALVADIAGLASGRSSQIELTSRQYIERANLNRFELLVLDRMPRHRPCVDVVRERDGTHACWRGDIEDWNGVKRVLQSLIQQPGFDHYFLDPEGRYTESRVELIYRPGSAESSPAG